MKQERKQLRLESFDYHTSRAYFVTICTHNKQKTLGDICRGDPRGLPRTALSILGKFAESTLADIEMPEQIEVDKYVIMPNHVHLIVNLYAPNDSHEGCHYSLSQVVGKYKSLCANRWLSYCKENRIEYHSVWQRSFHDHIIRCDADYEEIWHYIDENPIKWELDKYY